MMADRLNAALYEVKRSAIREFNQLARETEGCISLTLGEPDFETPETVRESAKRALDAGETHYIENNGTYALRRDIADFERRVNQMDYTPDEVIVTVGATEGLFMALLGILNPGDEVIVPTPAFGLYESIIGLCRGRFVPVATEDNGFQIHSEMLECAVTGRTKAILLNSPNNPTGCILSRESLLCVRAFAAKHNLFVLCDDVYRQLVYTDTYEAFASFRELRDRIIVIQSFSKPYAMTGWRVGYLLADLPVKRELEKIHQFNVVSATSIAQGACQTALRCNPSEMIQTYRRRRDFTVARLSEIGLSVNRPEGAFYAFPSIAQFGMDSTTFCKRMVREAKLAVTPGICFGSDKHIRLSYCCSDEQLREGLNRLEQFVKYLK